MVRAPCCEKMGLKKGPWTADEDQILVAYVQRHGHENWRALPKQAGLLRCGKSCRLRWMNYLRPDIKRGNFSREEEDMIINLRETLGNRWSAIAARLPGRTDNEIKNVWHTHLKKRAEPNHTVKDSKRKSGPMAKSNDQIALYSNSVESISNPSSSENSNISPLSTSSAWSETDVSSSGTNSPSIMTENYELELDESFWNEALSMEDCATAVQGYTLGHVSTEPDSSLSASFNDQEVDYWLRIFKEAGELKDLPEL